MFSRFQAMSIAIIESKMRGHIALVFLLAALSSAVEINRPQYLITSPAVYRVDEEEKVTVLIIGSKPCQVQVRLKPEGSRTTAARASGTFEPGERGTLKLRIPRRTAIRKKYFDLDATVCGVKTNSKRVEAKEQKQFIFIQTDKPIYKPGQKIRIRIISLNKHLKPNGKKLETVQVSVSETKIKQWNNVKLEDGIASLELQLSKEPVLGTYTVAAVVGKSRQTASIEVDKYVLPKFEVEIKPPAYMALDQKEFTTTICAKYTYGKDVKGTLNAVLCLKQRKLSLNICHNITREIKGCTDISLKRADLKIGEIKYLPGAEFVIDAQVKESSTGITMKKQAVKRDIKKRSVELSFSGTSTKFKPGLPFKYVLKVTRPDGSPATGTKVRVTVRRGSRSGIFYDKTLVVRNGLIMDSIDDATYNAQTLSFKAELLEANPYPVKIRSFPVYTTFSAKPWYSPSLSYLEVIKTNSTPARIDSEAFVKVRYTVRNNTERKIDFHYTIMCKGNIVKTDTHKRFHDYTPNTNSTTSPARVGEVRSNATTKNSRNPTSFLTRRFWWVLPKPKPLKKLGLRPLVETFYIKFQVRMEMVPSCRVMVYYVRKDKEVVADSVELDVEDKLENQVLVSFENDESKPGEKTNLILKATPRSRVAFVAVDKSLLLLKAGNELTKKKIRPYLQTNQGRASNSNPKCQRNRRWRGKRRITPLVWGHTSSYDDASEAFNVAGVVFISNLNINTKACPEPIYVRRYDLFRRRGMYRGGYLTSLRPMVPVGLRGGGPSSRGGRRRVLFTSRKNIPKKDTSKKKLKKEEKPLKIRKEFPETWLWVEEKLAESGNKTLQVTVPDTITTWVANGFAISAKTGLGISDTATIKIFQPFFVQMTLPYSVIRGEEIPIIVTVFNYLPSCVAIKLQLNHKSADYKVTSYHINKMCACGDAGQSVKFTIIPAKLGHIPLTVTATTSSARLCSNSTVFAQDAVTRKLLVEPEGIRKEYTQGTFFCPGDGEYQKEFDLQLPKHIVPGSVYPTVTIIGDIMGPAMNNLEDLLRMPYGCGEQNMANFAPNIYIMEYLTKTDQVTTDIKSKAENFMEVGYQRELRYKRKSGSYSAFGDSDKRGSMMLTAFVVRSFARAKKYIFIDDKQVEHSLEWFRKKQQANGCFPQYGTLCNKRLQGGINSELTITAYVTTALLEAGESTKSAMVFKALSCITSRLDSIKDSYGIALVTYTLMLAKHSYASKMMKLLRDKAVKKDDLMYWTEENKPTPSPYRYYHYYKSSAEIEMTAYALLAILHEQNHKNSSVTDETIDIIRWLSKQRNSYGGFASTQDTCVALQALAEFAEKAYISNADFRSSQLSGSLKMGNYYNHDFVVTKDNKLTLQTVELPAKIIPGKLQVSGQGVGCALIQATLKYNVPDPEDIPVFDINVGIRARRSAPDEERTPCSALTLDITAKWLKEDASNMAVVDIKLVTGFSVREESLKNLKKSALLNFKRYDIDGQNVQLYFDQIKDITFSIDIHQDTLVKKLKPAVVKVYDYYEPENQAKVMYKIGEAECYGDRIHTECPKCMTLENAYDLIRDKVGCNSTVTRMKSMEGMLKVIKAFSNYTKEQRKRIMKKQFEYQIPDFCPCEEIYDSQRAIMIGEGSYFKEDGLKTTIVLNSGTTILKYTGKSMKPQIGRMKEQLSYC